MSKLIFPLVLVFASIGIILLLIVPGWQHFLAVRADSKHLDEINVEIDTLTQKRDALNKQIIGITQDNFDRLDQMVPSAAHGPEFLVSLEQLAQGSGLSVVKLDLSGVLSTKPKLIEKTVKQPSVIVSTPNIQSETLGPPGTNVNNANVVVVGQAKAQTYQIMNATMEIAGSYEAFKNFLRDMESSVRITDVESLDFSPISGNSNFSFKINLKTYYQ